MNNSINSDDQNYLKHLSVLYVEDEEDIREQLAVFLKRRVANVYTAVNGQAGLDVFAQCQPDLVITDIRMPVMDGLEMAARIRAMNPNTPIIITTAFEENRYFQRAIDLGVDKYVIKPFNLDILDAILLKTARNIRSEAAMYEVEQRYRLLFELSHIPISIAQAESVVDTHISNLTMDGRIKDCNAAFLGLLGYQHIDELTALSFSDLLLPETKDQVNQLFLDEVLVRGFSREYELEIHRKNGDLVPVILQFILQRDAKGNPIEIWAVMRDISELRQAKQALHLAGLVFDKCGDAILISDGNNHVISVNRGFSKLTGYSQEDIIGQSPHLLSSGKHDQRFYQQMWEILLATGYWQGEIWNRRKNGEVYPEWLSITVVRNRKNQIVNYIAIFNDITELKATTEHIHFLAHYDPLTHLANRSHLEAQAQQLMALAVRNKSQLALLFIDVDRFKIINDSLGHAAGDTVLEIVARRLQKDTRDIDIVARLGGDEFIVILPNLNEASDAQFVARKLVEAIRQPMQIDGHILTVTSSIGISLYPVDSEDYETLLKNADTAMYNAKKSGRDNFMFFSSSMNIDVAEQLAMENALRRALVNQEFELYYQPQFDLNSVRIIGMEALLRWQSSELGMMHPGHFISLAEESGLIIPIGEWVLHEACRQNNAWQQQGLPAVTVAVNLSALQFRQNNLIQIVESALKNSGLSPDYLELELTESIVMQDVESTLESIANLKKIGLKLSIDDFGTGYSSLSYLKRFAIDKLKIDQSFIFNLPGNKDDKAIVKAIISLGHALNLTVIAEGVETPEAASFLSTHLCDQVQGYLYSKPIPAAAMTELLRNLITIG